MRTGRWWIAGAVGIVGLAAFVLVWFEPQALFIDERVSDPVPVVADAPSTTAAAPAAQAPAATTTTATPGPVDLATGTFVSRDHGTTGTVRVLQLADGSRYVRLEGLATDNGPDVYVYLSTNPADGPEQAFDDEFTNLGRLQGNLGDQNYLLPPDIDPLAHASVVLWCDRFNSAFGAADLVGVQR